MASKGQAASNKGGDSFVRDRLQWLDAITANPKVSAGAFRLAYVISSHINRATGEAWPGLDRLAQLLDTNERTVRRLVDELVRNGYLEKKRGGDGRPNRYRMTRPDRTELSDQAEDRPDKKVQSDDCNPDKNVHSANFRPDISRHSDRTFNDIQTGQKCPPNPLKEPIEEPLENISADSSLSKSQSGSEFDEFWRHYPRKVSKESARKAFKTARKRVEHDTIIRGVMRYAAERQGQDHKFTKHPATWLRGGCWDDEPAERPPPLKSTFATVIEGILGRYDSGADDLVIDGEIVR